MNSLIRRIFGVPHPSNQELEYSLKEHLERLQKVEQQEQEESPQTPDNTNDQPSSNVDVGRIVFNVDEKGCVAIQIQWSHATESIAEALGTLLYYINSGKLNQQCENILNATMQNNPQMRPFIRQIGQHWTSNIKKSEQTVKPSEVFQIGRQHLTRPDQAGKKVETGPE